MKRIMRVLAATVTAVATVGLGVSPAAADDDEADFFQPPTPYEFKYEFDPECPNVDLLVKGKAEGVDSIRNVPGSDGQAFLG